MSLPDYMLAGRKRPTGITILSVLHFLGVFGFAVLAFFLVRSNDPQIRQGFANIGISFPVVVCAIALLSALAFASGIGMWCGAKWGWFLGSFYYAYSIVTNINALLSIDDILSAFPAEDTAHFRPGPAFYYGKFGFRLALSALIYLYFFKENVREYFGLQNAKKWPAVVVHFAVCIGIAVAYNKLATVAP
jgi:hypothetical protein